MAETPPVCDLCDAHRDDASGRLRVLPPVFRAFGASNQFTGSLAGLRNNDTITATYAAWQSGPGAEAFSYLFGNFGSASNQLTQPVGVAQRLGHAGEFFEQGVLGAHGNRRGDWGQCFIQLII